MSHATTGMRVAGLGLVTAGTIWVVSLALHPPPPPDVPGFMTLIAETGGRWALAHWGAALALSLFAATSLVVLSARSRLTERPVGMAAWALLPIASLWVLTTAVAEATVMAQAAAAGDLATLEAWQVFAEGKAMGFMGIGAAVALIAAEEARSVERITPAWTAWVAVGAATTGIVGWILGPIAGIGIGGLLFVVSSVVFGLWILWFGVALARTDARTAAEHSTLPRSTKHRHETR